MKIDRLQRFLVFTAPRATARKAFVASFDSRERAIQSAETLKVNESTRWQVIDNDTAEVVAEDPGR